MSGTEFGVRRATAQDAELLARLGAETFPGNFVGLTAPAGMAAYITRSFTPEQQATELAEPGSVFFIAQTGTEAIGYARLRRGDTPNAVRGEASAEIHRLYVVQGHWGSGVGRALIRACLEEATAQGCDSVWLGAWGENSRALAFYASAGFEKVGTKTFQLGDETDLDLVFERDLTRT